MLRPLLVAGETPVGYVRESRCEGFNYYTAHRGARSLIVAFSSANKDLGVPIAYFLQMLRDDLYDVLVLYDRRKLHFDRGIAGLSDSFLETVPLIKAFAQSKGYHEVITFGSSMGGYPALRAGLLLGADRAISISGKYCWHVGRLLRNQESAGAFDVLCPLLRRSARGNGCRDRGSESERYKRP